MLGIPSFLFGIALFRMKRGSDRPGMAGHPLWSKTTGILLMLSALANGTTVGGGFFSPSSEWLLSSGRDKINYLCVLFSVWNVYFRMLLC